MPTNSDNTSFYIARLHWIIFAWPFIFTAAALFIAASFPVLQWPGLILSFAGFAWLIMTWIQYHFSSLIIQKNQVTLRSGFLMRQTVDIQIQKIESVDVRQSIFGSILRYGWLLITGTGGTRYGINFINAPLTCRRYIEQLVNERT